MWTSKDKWHFKTNECIGYIKLANKGNKVLGITDKNEVIDETIVPNDIKTCSELRRCIYFLPLSKITLSRQKIQTKNK